MPCRQPPPAPAVLQSKLIHVSTLAYAIWVIGAFHCCTCGLNVTPICVFPMHTLHPTGLIQPHHNRHSGVAYASLFVLLCAALFRYRHLMNDMINLIPHCKKDTKLDTKSDRGVINEVADMKVGAGRQDQSSAWHLLIASSPLFTQKHECLNDEWWYPALYTSTDA